MFSAKLVMGMAVGVAFAGLRGGFAFAAEAAAGGGMARIWVAPEGDDRNAGSALEPLRTPAMALRAARNLRRLKSPEAAGGIEINFDGGEYLLDTPLVIRPEDSGTTTSPTVLRAVPKEKPLLSGGVRLTGWREGVLGIRGLQEQVQTDVWISEPVEFGGGALTIRQLWVDGKKGVRARTPNADMPMARLLQWNRKTEEAGIETAVFGRMTQTQRLEMVIGQQWETANLRVRSVRVQGAMTTVTFQQPESKIEFEHPWPQPLQPPDGPGGAFCLVNAPEFLDQPGEWWQDPATGRVLYFPRAGEDMTKAEAYAPGLENIVQIEGTLDRPVRHVELRGLEFKYGAWTQPGRTGHVPLQAGMRMTESYKIRPAGTVESPKVDNQDWIERLAAAVTVKNANHITVADCLFEHTAASGLDFVSGTQDDKIVGCVFRDIGGNGIQMGSFQEGATETHVPYNPADEREIVAREEIRNCLVTDAANEDWGCVAILAGYVRDTKIEHNDVRNVSYTGINVGWGWTRSLNAMRNNIVRANRLDHVATRMCDTAGIYTLSNQPGTVVSENACDNINISPNTDRPQHWGYYYTDEGSDNMMVRDNWCPAEKFIKNQNGAHCVWENNGPMVSAKIKDAAGLEPEYRHLLER